MRWAGDRSLGSTWSDHQWLVRFQGVKNLAINTTIFKRMLTDPDPLRHFSGRIETLYVIPGSNAHIFGCRDDLKEFLSDVYRDTRIEIVDSVEDAVKTAAGQGLPANERREIV
jgi:hypothetical protein